MAESLLGKSWEYLSGSTLRTDDVEKHWRNVASFEAERVPVSAHVSLRTGTRVMVAKVPGPLVSCHFTLATEARASDYALPDDGLPHTLEHLVFMGSDAYPYKGVIDQLASKSLAQGTNAWTDVDHTAFTLTTAGPEGFLSMLPVFMDHILFPSLKDDAFYTEVYHVSPDGGDSGVVYMELEGRQNIAADMCRQRLLDLIYPDGSGYRSATGGRVENIRRLTSHAVRQYHRHYYRPDNLCVIVTGQVNVKDVFRMLEAIEQKVVARGELPPLVRPWFNTTRVSSEDELRPARSAAEGLRFERVVFPSDDESAGHVLIGWEGPFWHEFQEVQCLRIMWLYLAESPASPLSRALVEGDSPLCQGISFVVQEGMPGSHYVHFEKAAVSHLERIYDVFVATVRKEVQDGVDLARMRSIVNREKLRHLCGIEEDPHNTFAVMLLYSFLYGDRDGLTEAAQLKDRVQNTISRLEALPVADGNEEAKPFWAELMRRWVLEPRGGITAVVLGAPSAPMARELVRTELRRKEQQMQTLSEDERAALAAKLASAVDANSKPCPGEIIDSHKTPDVAQVPEVPVVSVRNIVPPEGEAIFEVLSTHPNPKGAPPPDPSLLPNPRFVLREPTSSLAIQLALQLFNKGLSTDGELPFLIQWDHVPSSFAEVTIWFETSTLPDHLRPLLELLFEIIFELPVRQDDGTLWSHEEVIRYLAADTVSFSNAIGTGRTNFYCGVWGQAASITVKVEGEKYWYAVRWVRNLLYRTEVCVDRVRAAAQKLLNDLQRLKRDGMSICSALVRVVSFDSLKSNHSATSLKCQFSVLTGVMHKLRTHPSAVVADLHALLEALTKPDNLRVHVVGDLMTQPDPVRPWIEEFVPVPHARSADTSGAAVERGPIVLSRQLRTPDVLNPTGKGFLLSSSSIDGGYMVQCVPVDLTYGEGDHAALLVADEYLMGVEGELWRRIRGLNLAYGYELTCSPEQGLLSFSIYRATDLTAAYQEAHEVVMAYASGAAEIEQLGLEAAKRSVVFEYIDRVWTISTAAEQSCLNYFRGTPQTYCADLMATVMAVTLEDVLAAFNTHLVRLFDSSTSTVVLCCHSSKALRVKHAFTRELGRPQLEAGTVEQYFTGRAEQEDVSDSCSTSESSELASLDGSCRGGSSGWLKSLGRNVDKSMLVGAACAVASVAFIWASKSKRS